MIESIQNFLTPEMVHRIFEYLTLCEISKAIGWGGDAAEGQQDGYIQCLEDMFGISSEGDRDETFYSVVDLITSGLSSTIKNYRQRDIDLDEWIQIREIVTQHVEQFIINNYSTCAKTILAR